MLKSLFSGVSGLQSHQVAMDIESNNIANVNTTGFKYSRANFSDLLAQTTSIATAPQGNLGGKNAVQVGLGSIVASATRIFSQGSIQNSDKNTDVAIQGDGFFIVSPDGGNTYKYTRAGDFKFDANGNFVDNSGFVTQGWLRDEVTGKVDSAGPIANVQIAPGLTTPSSPTQEVVLKANLNSGTIVSSYSAAYEVPSGTPPSKASPAIYTGDAIDDAGAPIGSGNLGVMFNESGEAFSLQSGQGVWASFYASKESAAKPVAGGDGALHELDITFTLDDGSKKQVTSSGGTVDDSAAQNASRYVSAINAQTSVTGITASYNATTNRINLVNDNSNANASHNINISAVGNANGGFNPSVKDTVNTTAYKYQYAPTGASPTRNGHKTFNTISDLRYAMEVQARAVGDHDDVTPAAPVDIAIAATDGNDAVFTIDGQLITITDADLVAAGNTPATSAALFIERINAAGITDISAIAGTNADEIVIVNSKITDVSLTSVSGAVGANITGTVTAATVTAGVFKAPNPATFASALTGATFILAGIPIIVDDQAVAPVDAATSAGLYATAINSAGIAGISARVGSLASGDAAADVNKVIIENETTNDISLITNASTGLSGLDENTTEIIPARVGNNIEDESNIEISVNAQGKFEITNPGGSADGDYDMNLKITALKDISAGIVENTKFTVNMTAMNAVLPAGSTGKVYSQAFNAATHSSSIDVFDSLGSKHTLRMEFRKTALDKTTGSTWDMLVSVPAPARIDTIAPTNEKTGSIRFNSDGSLATYNPPNISFSGNNGSAPDQRVNLSFGTSNALDGMTSFDSESSTSGISQDGFTGGDLVGIRIDQSGTVVGSFSNGRSFGLAQIAMAKFTNNEGLSTEGGNIYIQTSNSGDPIIGTAATSGRGFIQSSALEASNVDLSRALTELIIIQRGYQANGKTITTSDQLLQTLIGLKN